MSVYDAAAVQAEFDAQREETVRALSGMIYSCDQNGHLLLHRNDIGVLTSAIELLNRAQARQR